MAIVLSTNPSISNNNTYNYIYNRNTSSLHPRKTPRFSNPDLRICSNRNRPRFYQIVGKFDEEKAPSGLQGEISPLMPNSCRYLPTCSEYSMTAYKKYGVAKGTILTAWRLCRCNPLGGSGFDPPRWFDETSPPEE